MISSLSEVWIENNIKSLSDFMNNQFNELLKIARKISYLKNYKNRGKK